MVYLPIFFQAVSSACAIAKHRKANNIEVEDVQVLNDDDPVQCVIRSHFICLH